MKIPNIEMVSTALLRSSNANTVTKLHTLQTTTSRSRGITTTNNTSIRRTFMELGPLMMVTIMNIHQMTVTRVMLLQIHLHQVRTLSSLDQSRL